MSGDVNTPEDNPELELYAIAHDPGHVQCCTPVNAWTWARELAVMALGGDGDATRVLPFAVEHYLQSYRIHGAPAAPVRCCESGACDRCRRCDRRGCPGDCEAAR